MPKVKQHKARTDIYDRGIKIPDEKTKSGFRRDLSQPADEKDTLFCKKGDTYYAWGMMVGGRGVQRKSITPPKRSQLTNSDFLGQIYDMEDSLDFGDCDLPESLQEARDDIAQQLRDLGSEQSDKFSNMPDGLQQGSTGELLEQRAEACEAIADQFEGVDLDYEEPDEEELKTELKDEDEDASGEEITERLEQRKQEHLDDWLDEKRAELKEVSWEYE